MNLKTSLTTDQFALGHLIIDGKRGTITSGTSEQKVEPRAMAVLLYLANHPNQVISQEELFNNIWPNTLFSPGAIQRCIGLLRKAMGDNAKSANFIVTHPKRGYSLDVSPKAIPVINITLVGKVTLPLLAFVIPLLVYLLVKQSPNVSYEGQITAITSSSHYDFNPIAGQQTNRVIFIRQFDQGSHIFSVNTETGEEDQLSSEIGDYRSISWDFEFKRLYYVNRSQSGDQVGVLNLSSPQPKQNNLFTLNSTGNVWHVLAVKNKIYYMLAHVPVNQAPKTELKIYDHVSDKHVSLLSSDDHFTPYRITMSPDKTSIAIAGESAENRVEFRLFDLTDHTLGPSIHHLPLGFTELNWHPDGKHILVHHMNRLYLLNVQGEATSIPYHHFQRIHNPSFNNDGSQILLTASSQDTDIWQYDLKTEAVNKIADSSGEDHLGRLSPVNNDLAYISNRSGRAQVFLKQGVKETLIFDNPNSAPIYRAPVWSHDETKLVFAAGHQLYFHDVFSGRLTQTPMPGSFTAVLDWFNHEPALLISIKQDNQSYFAKWNIESHELTLLEKTGVNFFARLNEHDQLVFHRSGLISGLTATAKQNGSIANRRLFAVTDQLVYQTQDSVVHHSHSNLTESITKIPVQNAQLIDVSQDGQQLLFVSFERQNAQIISLH